jgi:hypothetical protein
MAQRLSDISLAPIPMCIGFGEQHHLTIKSCTCVTNKY